MKSKITITLEHQVTCDRCGFRIRPGEKCIVIMDSMTGKALFQHRQCPSAPAAHTNGHPVPPKRFSRNMNMAFAN